MTCVLTFDLGTTNFKAALYGDDLKPMALTSRPTPSESPQPGWGQIDADRFAHTLTQLVEELCRRAPQAWSTIVAVSFATQANSTLLLDEADRPLTPILLWNDRRAVEDVDQAKALIEQDDFYMCTGIPHYIDGLCPGKLLWLREHEPTTFRRAARVCLISDYLTLLLTGEHATEASVAGLTGLLNIHDLTWRRDAIAALRADHLGWPRVVRAGEMLGPMTRSMTSAWQLPENTPLIAGCLDQYAGAIGTGSVRPGSVSETTGTVLATVSLSDHFDPDLRQRGVYQGPAFRAGWYFRMIFSEVSANLLDAFRRNFAAEMSFDQLIGLAAQTPPGCEGLRLDAQASTSRQQPIFNEHPCQRPIGHRVRAILEGVADELHGQVRYLLGDVQPDSIAAAGGAARSALWLNIKSDRLGLPVVATTDEQPTSRGAAALALAAVTASPLKSVFY